MAASILLAAVFSRAALAVISPGGAKAGLGYAEFTGGASKQIGPLAVEREPEWEAAHVLVEDDEGPLVLHMFLKVAADRPFVDGGMDVHGLSSLSVCLCADRSETTRAVVLG